MPGEYFVDYRWFLERQTEILPGDLSVNDFSVLMGMAARHKVDPPRHDKLSDPFWRAAVFLEECVLLRPLPARKRTKWVVAIELVAFARDQRTRERDRTGRRSPQRPGTEIAAEQTAHYEEVLRTLTEREQRQKKALARTRAAQRAAEQKLARARARLTAEIDAVARLGFPAARTTTTEKEARP
ncbi:hypothetical protein ACFPM3_20540 [Streptomyces coeruleoprunus]|uniref:Uncharacterized protein n=1 Tax=Streptomyces coeruleoprunus TaxID=285563 RepID=A0ABV9XJ43_9ACTN